MFVHGLTSVKSPYGNVLTKKPTNRGSSKDGCLDRRYWYVDCTVMSLLAMYAQTVASMIQNVHIQIRGLPVYGD